MTKRFEEDLELFLANKTQSLIRFKCTSVMGASKYTVTEKRRASRWLNQCIKKGSFVFKGFWIKTDPSMNRMYIALPLDTLSDSDLLELVLDTMKCERRELIEQIKDKKRRLQQLEETRKELTTEINETNNLIFQMCVECKKCKKDTCRDMKCPLWPISPKRSKPFMEANND